MLYALPLVLCPLIASAASTQNVPFFMLKIEIMKIFEFTYDADDIYWVMAPDKQAAIEYYTEHYHTDMDNTNALEIPKDQWGENHILDINEMDPLDYDNPDYNEDEYSCGYKIGKSLAEYAKENNHTHIIAETNY